MVANKMNMSTKIIRAPKLSYKALKDMFDYPFEDKLIH